MTARSGSGSGRSGGGRTGGRGTSSGRCWRTTGVWRVQGQGMGRGCVGRRAGQGREGKGAGQDQGGCIGCRAGQGKGGRKGKGRATSVCWLRGRARGVLAAGAGQGWAGAWKNGEGGEAKGREGRINGKGQGESEGRRGRGRHRCGAYPSTTLFHIPPLQVARPDQRKDALVGVQSTRAVGGRVQGRGALLCWQPT